MTTLVEKFPFTCSAAWAVVMRPCSAVTDSHSERLTTMTDYSNFRRPILTLPPLLLLQSVILCWAGDALTQVRCRAQSVKGCCDQALLMSSSKKHICVNFKTNVTKNTSTWHWWCITLWALNLKQHTTSVHYYAGLITAAVPWGSDLFVFIPALPLAPPTSPVKATL